PPTTRLRTCRRQQPRRTTPHRQGRSGTPAGALWARIRLIGQTPSPASFKPLRPRHAAQVDGELNRSAALAGNLLAVAVAITAPTLENALNHPLIGVEVTPHERRLFHKVSTRFVGKLLHLNELLVLAPFVAALPHRHTRAVRRAALGALPGQSLEVDDHLLPLWVASHEVVGHDKAVAENTGLVNRPFAGVC